MSRLHHTSASAIDTFRDCARKYVLRYLEGHRTPPNAYAAFGSHLHKVLERYLQTGWLEQGPGIALQLTLPSGKQKTWAHTDIAELVLPGIPYLPAPGVAETEKKFLLALPDDLPPLLGYKDYRYTDTGLVIVGDHKSTGDLKWALSSEDLETNTQAVCYAQDELSRGASEVQCRWGYFCRNRPAHKQSVAHFSSTSIAHLWDGVLSDVRAMVELEGVPIEEVEPTESACMKYGGCPYRGNLCQLSAGRKLKGWIQMSALKERMKAAKAAKAAQAPVAQAPVAQAPVAQAAQAPVAQAPAAQAAQAPAAQAPAAQAPAAQAPAAQAAQAPAASLNPPEAKSALERLRAAQAARAAETAPAETAPAETAPVETAPAETAPAETAATAPAETAQAANMRRMLYLYIDCAPNSPYTELSDLLAPVLAEIKQEHGHHYRLIDGLYGGNAALLAEAVGVYLDTDMPHDQLAVVCSTANPLTRDTLEALESRAIQIIRGF